MNELAPFEYFVGIDPGANTGFGIIDKDDKYLHSGTSDFWGVVKQMDEAFEDKSKVRMFVELPPKFMFSRNEKEVAEQDNARMLPGASKKITGEQLQGRKNFLMGGVYRESILLLTGFERLGFSVEHVLPVREPGGGKWDERRFRLFTKSAKKTSEHERDAVRIAYFYKTKK